MGVDPGGMSHLWTQEAGFSQAMTKNKAAHDSSTFAKPDAVATRGRTNYLDMKLREQREYCTYLQGLLKASGIPYKKAHQ